MNEETTSAQKTTYDIKDFILDCETLLERHGESDRAFVSGSLHQARVYNTPGLTVKRSEDGEFEITIHYYYQIEGRAQDARMDNPVVCRNKEGKIFRTHGEWHYAKTRVKRLLAGEAPAEPIRLGKSEAGWTSGID